MITKLRMGEKVVDVTEVPFRLVNPEDDRWVPVALEDGTIVNVKWTPTKFYRVEGEFNPMDGAPVYHLNYVTLQSVSAPASLCQI